MQIPERVRADIEAVVHAAFPEDLIEEVHIEDVTVDTEAREIRITLVVSTAVNPTQFAESYFGLTGKVRRFLAGENDTWRRFFPIITPSVGHGVHA
ncbi:hypothetical protein KMP13_18900 [Epibacterium ulvae]|uniref:hypothetical protein n=1 Tax=Epibacterium ulvae TaxID=1156985 RepID=UPI001BFC7F20|nr:hypothetical protein [Epibacterium ulvae]MBT8155890.1 hypothetical protein [Epibacterium ulvae]